MICVRLFGRTLPMLSLSYLLPKYSLSLIPRPITRLLACSWFPSVSTFTASINPTNPFRPAHTKRWFEAHFFYVDFKLMHIFFYVCTYRIRCVYTILKYSLPVGNCEPQPVAAHFAYIYHFFFHFYSSSIRRSIISRRPEGSRGFWFWLVYNNGPLLSGSPHT